MSANPIFDELFAAELAALVPDTRPLAIPPAGTYGSDLVCVDDLDPQVRHTDPTTQDALVQLAYHHISGNIPAIDQAEREFGIDLIAFLHEGTTARQLQVLQAAIETELKKDDLFQDAKATVVYQYATETLVVSIQVFPTDPRVAPFTMVVSVKEATELLSVE